MEKKVRGIEKGEGSEKSNISGLHANLKWRTSNQRKVHGGALVGKIITEKNINRMASIRMIRKDWNLEKREDLEIVDVDRNAFIFEFRRCEEYLRILRGRPWSIQGFLLNIQQWNESMVFKEVDFDYSPFWIQFHDLPQGVMDLENVEVLGRMIGEVAMVEDPRKKDLLVRSFLRARVMVDLRKPLITGMWTPRPDGDPIWIKAKYERLQNFCFRCGRIGHDKRSCKEVVQEEAEEEERFGSWLCVQAVRSMEDAVICCIEEWEEFVGGKEKNGVGGGGSMNSPKERLKKDVKKDSGSDQRFIERKGADVNVVEVQASKDRCEERKSQKDEDLIRKKRFVTARGSKGKQVSPKSEIDLSRAIVVYGSISPLSDITNGLKRVGLKRRFEEKEERGEVKKRRLTFEEMIVTEKTGCNLIEVQGGESRVGRVVRRNVRRGGGRRGGMMRRKLLEVVGGKENVVVEGPSIVVITLRNSCIFSSF